MQSLMIFAIVFTLVWAIIGGIKDAGLQSFANCERTGGVPVFQENTIQGWVCKKG